MQKETKQPSQMSSNERLYEISKILANTILAKQKGKNTCLYDQ